jgi:hypothetical protein
MQIDRSEGFYWIAYGGQPEIASWENGQWWGTGSDVPLCETNLKVLSERLLPPASQQHGSG